MLKYRPANRSINKNCFCTACVNINKKRCPSGCKKFNCLATASRYLTSYEPNIFNNSISFCEEIKSNYHPKYTPFYVIKMNCQAMPNSQQNENNDEEFSDFRIKSPSTNERRFEQ